AMTQCIPAALTFHDLGPRAVVATFDGGAITSDAGVLLLRELEHRFRFVEQFATCFTDHRDPRRTEHSLLELLKQRLFGLCLGYLRPQPPAPPPTPPAAGAPGGKGGPPGAGRNPPPQKGKGPGGQDPLHPPRTHPRPRRQGQPLQEGRRPPRPDASLPRR